MRLVLTALLVADYDAAIDFYVRKVGFDLVEDTDQGGGKRWVVVRPPGSDAALLLARATGDQAARVGDQGGGRVMFFLETDDFARDQRRMAAAGVRFLEAPRHEPYGIVAVFEDLYGNRWDLIERAPAASAPPR
jgi:catechol 2,3-dioxygenase-like lactoylglutathione lyase family enzyme